MSEDTITMPMSHTDTSTPEAPTEVAPVEGVEGLDTGGTIVVTGSAEDATLGDAPAESPDLILGKFKSQEELVKAYTELEKSKSAPEAEPVVETPTADEESEPAEAGSVEDYQNKWLEQGGKLSDEQWADIQTKTGVPMETLRAYESSMVAESARNLETADQAIYAEAGGQDKYDTMIDWASKSLDANQLDALDAQLDSPIFSKMGVQALKSAYESANGTEPTVTLGETKTNSLSDSTYFQSEVEMQQAMAHKDYGINAAYDQEFDRKAIGYMKMTGQM
jgi:hypothetical protein